MQFSFTLAPDQMNALPDHTQLPDRDGTIVENFQEHPQSNILTDCLLPRLHQLYLDGQFAIGCDSGIYWRHTHPPLNGCRAPDWFLVVGVPPMLDGQMRRSYVLWQEVVKPLIVIEYVSGDGRAEHDATPYTGKFWVYEQGISAGYYAIFDASKPSIELYRQVAGRYALVQANAAGRFPVEPLGIELGIWEGEYREMQMPWLRVWDAATGIMLPLSEEQIAVAQECAATAEGRAETAEGLLDDARRMLDEETERAENERKRAENERKRADAAEVLAKKFAEKFRALGIDPEA